MIADLQKLEAEFKDLEARMLKALEEAFPIGAQLEFWKPRGTSSFYYTYGKIIAVVLRNDRTPCVMVMREPTGTVKKLLPLTMQFKILSSPDQPSAGA